MPTIYYLGSAAQATGVHAAAIKDAIITSTVATQQENVSTGAGADQLAWAFTSGSGVPNQADWPNGTYSAELNCTACGADSTYGVRTLGGSAGHFARVDSGLTADSETAQDTQAAFTGTGIKLASVSWDPAAGNASDRLEILVATANAGTMSQTVSLTLNGTDSEVSFPDAAATTPFPPYPMRRIEQRIPARRSL